MSRPYQLTSLSWSFRERNAVRFAADLSILISRRGLRFSGTRVWSVLVDPSSLHLSVFTFSISSFIVICHLVVKNQILNSLLFLPIRLLLALHGNSKARI